MTVINYSVFPLNPNEFLSRQAALDYLVDACINVEEYEWAACSVKLKSRKDAEADIIEVANAIGVKFDATFISEAYAQIEENNIPWYS